MSPFLTHGVVLTSCDVAFTLRTAYDCSADRLTLNIELAVSIN